jgi:hypothetical protein
MLAFVLEKRLLRIRLACCFLPKTQQKNTEKILSRAELPGETVPIYDSVDLTEQTFRIR